MTRRTARVNAKVVYRRLGERMILVHLDSNQIYELNETSARLWELLGQDGDLDVVQRRLALEYDVDGADLRGEVEEALRLFIAAGLVVEVVSA